MEVWREREAIMTMLQLSLVCVLTAVCLVVGARALAERSWERLKWLGFVLVAVLAITAFGFAADSVKVLPFGVGALLEALCGLIVFVTGALGFWVLFGAIFAPLHELKSDTY